MTTLANISDIISTKVIFYFHCIKEVDAQPTGNLSTSLFVEVVTKLTFCYLAIFISKYIKCLFFTFCLLLIKMKQEEKKLVVFDIWVPARGVHLLSSKGWKL